MRETLIHFTIFLAWNVRWYVRGEDGKRRRKGKKIPGPRGANPALYVSAAVRVQEGVKASLGASAII